jgi:uncharacterized protein
MDVTTAQPLGTPTWIDLGVPDLDRARAFYGAVFGWEFAAREELGGHTTCLLRGRAAAALSPTFDAASGPAWRVFLATPDCDETVSRVRRAGGEVLVPPTDVLDQGRMAFARDTTGAVFGLWQAAGHIGCEVVNEPGSLVRNDLVTSDPTRARAFYAQVFGFTLDANPAMPEADFTFLRRPDGHEVGGIMGAAGGGSAWATAFEVADTDAAVDRAVAHGGSSAGGEDFLYGRLAAITDPFGAQFSIITRPDP